MTIRAAAYRAAYFAFEALPSGVASGLGARLSYFAYRTSPGYNRRAATLFAALRPDWAESPEQLEAAVRRLWQHFSRTFGEFPSVHRMIRNGRITIENVERVDEAMASGRPVILVFVHTGNWEMAGIQLAYRYPDRIFAIYDLPTDVHGTDLVHQQRLKAPAEMIRSSPMIWRQVLTRLKRPGAVLWISADELNAGRPMAPFFDQPPGLEGNLGKVVRLAMRTGAIVVPFYSERHPGTRFTTHILPPMRFEGNTTDDATALEAVTALDAAFTPPVVRLLDQWFMALHYHGAPGIAPSDDRARPASDLGNE